MAKYRIITAAENCSGCLRCQLACSCRYTRKFKPAAAKIQVFFSDFGCQIEFSEACTACGICADSCYYGALVKQSEGVDNE